MTLASATGDQRTEGVDLGRAAGDQLFHSNSALSCILKSGRGRCRKSEAMFSSSPTSSWTAGFSPSVSASICSMAWSSSSKILFLFMIAPHFTAQGLQGAKLKLLDRPFCAPQLLRNFLQALLIDKPPENHQPLVRWKTLHQLKQHGASLNRLVRAGLFQNVSRNFVVSRLALPSVSQRIGGDPQEPRHKRNAAPLEVSQLCQCLVEDLRG